MEIYNRPWPLVPNKVRADGGRELDRFRGVEHPADTPNGAEAWVGSLTRANGATPENPNLGYAEVILPRRDAGFSGERGEAGAGNHSG